MPRTNSTVPSSAAGPLAGCRVLDLTRALSGPFSTMILADLGADVVKVEPLPHGDMTREWGPFANGESVYYLSTNRGKRSLAVDFRDPEGRAVLRKLAVSVDVLVENFRPGVTEALGLGYSELSQTSSSLIYASITGFGRGGPYENWPGFDQVAQGMSGLMSLTGSAETGPTRVGIPIADLTSALWATIGILAALAERRAIGRGQRVSTSLLESLISLLSFQGQQYLTTGRVPGPTGRDHPVLAPYGVFEAEDGLLSIAAATEDMWRSLCRELNLERLLHDPRYCDNAARILNRRSLRSELNRQLRTGGTEDWTIRLTTAGVPAGPVLSLEQVFEDRHVLAMGCVRTVDHPTLGVLKQLRNPLHFREESGMSHLSAPPLFGQHTVDILGEAGFSSACITELLQRGVVLQHTIRTRS